MLGISHQDTRRWLHTVSKCCEKWKQSLGSEHPSQDLMNSRSPSDKIQGTGRYPDGGGPGDLVLERESGRQTTEVLYTTQSFVLWSLSQVRRETMNSFNLRDDLILEGLLLLKNRNWFERDGRGRQERSRRFCRNPEARFSGAAGYIQLEGRAELQPGSPEFKVHVLSRGHAISFSFSPVECLIFHSQDDQK